MVIEQHAQHAGNYDAQRTYARDRMKEQIEDMNEFLREVILDIERDRLVGMYDDTWRSKSTVSFLSKLLLTLNFHPQKSTPNSSVPSRKKN